MGSLHAGWLMPMLVAAVGCASILGLDDYGAGGGGAAGASSSVAMGPGGSGGSTTSQGGQAGGGVGGTTGLSYPELVMSHVPAGYWRLSDGPCMPPCAATAEVGPAGSYTNGFTLGEQGVLAGDTALFIDDAAAGYVGMGTNFNYAAGTPFSVELWVKPHPDALTAPGVCDAGGFLSREQASSCMPDMRPGYLLRYTGNCRVRFDVVDCEAMVSLLALSTAELNESRWYHLVATYDGVEAALYVDGSVQATDSAANPQLVVDNANFVLGARAGGNFGSFNGWIDEAAVYAHVLSPQMISAHFAKATSLR